MKFFPVLLKLRPLGSLRVQAAFSIATLLIFLSCTAKPQENSSSSIARAFEKAGLRTLKESIPARDFSLPVASTGKFSVSATTQSLSELKGKAVFLNFWATWCGPCRSEMPSMEALYNKYRERGLEVFAVNIMEKEDEVLSFMEDNDLSFPAALDLDGKVSNSYGIQSIPTTFLINREGNIVVRLVGSIDWDMPEIHAAIEALLN